jgi:hypothetical protein
LVVAAAAAEARRVRALALALVVATSSPAFSQGMHVPWAENKPRNKFESPQWFAFELKFGGYSPHIDSSPGLKGTPFSDLFNPGHGQPGERLLTTLEFDFQFLHKIGSLGVGVAVGYGRRTTHAFQYLNVNGTGSCSLAAGNCVASGDQTALNMLPVDLLLIYRFDYLALKYKVPLVPYFKIGLSYWFWWIENGGGGVASVVKNPLLPNDKADGWGGTAGWVLNPGLAILLDVLDPAAARVMDSELGINHTYLFGELHYADINWFHRGGNATLDLSDVSYNVGLAFEF